jgi:nicotinamide phosphoribosyltransferase
LREIRYRTIPHSWAFRPYQHFTHDSFGFAVKSTYGEVDGVGRVIFKDPVTDNGVKKSARGLLRVATVDGAYVLEDRQASIDSEGCAMREVFRDGQLLVDETITEIWARLQAARAPSYALPPAHDNRRAARGCA